MISLRWLFIAAPLSWLLAWLGAPAAVVLVATYGASLAFSLVTHRQLFSESGGSVHATPAPYSPTVALAILAAATAFVAIESEILVHATETLVERFGLSQLFLGLIVIPLIGNAAEHATAVVVARRGQTYALVALAVWFI